MPGRVQGSAGLRTCPAPAELTLEVAQALVPSGLRASGRWAMADMGLERHTFSHWGGGGRLSTAFTPDPEPGPEASPRSPVHWGSNCSCCPRNLPEPRAQQGGQRVGRRAGTALLGSATQCARGAAPS